MKLGWAVSPLYEHEPKFGIWAPVGSTGRALSQVISESSQGILALERQICSSCCIHAMLNGFTHFKCIFSR